MAANNLSLRDLIARWRDGDTKAGYDLHEWHYMAMNMSKDLLSNSIIGKRFLSIMPKILAIPTFEKFSGDQKCQVATRSKATWKITWSDEDCNDIYLSDAWKVYAQDYLWFRSASVVAVNKHVNKETIDQFADMMYERSKLAFRRIRAPPIPNYKVKEINTILLDVLLSKLD